MVKLKEHEEEEEDPNIPEKLIPRSNLILNHSSHLEKSPKLLIAGNLLLFIGKTIHLLFDDGLNAVIAFRHQGEISFPPVH